MPDSQIFVFIISAILLTLAPGPDNIYVLTLGITKNKKSAVITSLGLCSGLIFHTLAVALGVAVIFKTLPIAFNIVKYLGALYLLYIAYQIFKHRNEKIVLDDENVPLDYKKLYLRGLIMNILNPKVSIFFLAFLPQFITKNSTNTTLEIISLGLIFIVIAFCIMSFIGILGNILKNKILAKTHIVKYLNTITSVVLVFLSISLAISTR